MLDKLKTLLFGEEGSPRLTELHPDEQVAVTAILLEAAEANHESSTAEHEMVIDLLRKRFGLDADQVAQLIRLTEETRAQSADLWPFTNTIARNYHPKQKEALLEMVWRVVFADGRLDPYEEQLTRRLQAMLSVNQSVLIQAKLRARRAIGSQGRS